ncbi:MAG TPA: PEP-CTERM sorting domain-containing protein [Anaerohalosphaeraceae bacterium]|nr:PEP-CTERM sorting domain-containing protein [Anaerohalosphaeraceae bacterium]
MKNIKAVLSVCVLVLSVCSYAESILAPGDQILAVDATGMVSRSSYPGGEAPSMVLDANSGTKYLNFAGKNSGFIVTPGAAGAVKSFVITTANDAAGRDPVSWVLYGTNDAISSADNSMGVSENWTQIDAGTVALPDARQTAGPVVAVNNTTVYSSYKMMYTTLKDNNTIMQVADVSFYESADATGSSFLSLSDSILAVHRDWDSRYPGGENPGKLIDGTLGKYLNFGKANAGFIVTPAKGVSLVQGFEITTANDWAERDPASWVLYGTNDDITSVDNSDGLMENWVLIDSGDLSLPGERNTLGSLVAVDNSSFFKSYKMLFPTLKNADATNSMQIAEIQFYGVPEPTTVCLLGLGGLALLRRRRSL